MWDMIEEENSIDPKIQQGYTNVAIIFIAIFAAGAIMQAITANFILMMEEYCVNGMMMGLLTAAFVFGGFVFLGAILLFKASKILGADPGKIVKLATGTIGLLGLLSGFTPDYWTMWIIRFAIGFAGILLVTLMIPITFTWFPEKLRLVFALSIVSMILGALISSYFGSIISQITGGWRGMHSVFGGTGLLAFVLWLKFGKPKSTESDGGGKGSSSRGPVFRILTNKYIWCSAAILYIVISFSGVFTFTFVALSGSLKVAVWSKSIVFSLPFYMSVLLNGAVIVMGGFMGLKLSSKAGMKRRLIMVSSLLMTIAGLALFSLTFSGIKIALILELVAFIMFLLVLIVPAWVTQVQELPGIGFDVILNAIGAILMICGIAAVIVPTSIGWALDQGWINFKTFLYFFVVTWSVCGLSNFLMPGSENK